MQYLKVFERMFVTKMKRQKSKNINRRRSFHYKESYFIMRKYLYNRFFIKSEIFISRIVSIALRLSTTKFLHIGDEN